MHLKPRLIPQLTAQERDSELRELSAEHSLFTTSRDPGTVDRRPIAKLLYNQTKLNTRNQHIFYILVKNTE